MPVVEGFEALTRGYLGQDWALDVENVDHALREFALGESAAEVAAAIVGFQQLLATAMSEQEYYDRWILGLGSGYDPRDDGFTYREWFAHAIDVLRNAQAPSTD